MKSRYDKYSDIIADRLYRLRLKFNLTQKDFANECGASSNAHICRYEKGDIRPGMQACQKIIKAAKKRNIDINLEWLRPDLFAS